MKPSTSTLNRLVLSTESTTRGQIKVEYPVRARRAKRSNKSVETAVYAHIRAVRSLGRPRVTTPEVAAALSLPIAEVNRASSSLEKKGVRAMNG